MQYYKYRNSCWHSTTPCRFLAVALHVLQYMQYQYLVERQIIRHPCLSPLRTKGTTTVGTCFWALSSLHLLIFCSSRDAALEVPRGRRKRRGPNPCAKLWSPRCLHAHVMVRSGVESAVLGLKPPRRSVLAALCCWGGAVHVIRLVVVLLVAAPRLARGANWAQVFGENQQNAALTAAMPFTGRCAINTSSL
jgi:hypothetical protein